MSTVQITAEYVGGKKLKLTHGPSGAQIITSPPVDNQGDGSSFSPTDLAASALMSCMMTLIAIVAERDGIDLAGMNAKVEKEMRTDPRRIARLPLQINLPRTVPEGSRQKLENAARTCPVHHSLHPEIEVPLTFRYEI